MHELKSIQYDDEDSSKYFINYLSDQSDDDYSEQSSDDQENIEDLPSCLIITPVPQLLFTDENLKTEFERLFAVFDSNIVVLYLKFFQRVRITFTSSTSACQARIHLHEFSFHGTICKTYFACPIAFRGSTSETFLRPPEPEKLFLISPPVSPPIGWEQKVEDPPVIDFNLVAAIAQLQPNETHELHPRQHELKTPAIVIHTCDDQISTMDEFERSKGNKPMLIQTRRPPQNV